MNESDLCSDVHYLGSSSFLLYYQTRQLYTCMLTERMVVYFQGVKTVFCTQLALTAQFWWNIGFKTRKLDLLPYLNLVFFCKDLRNKPSGCRLL